MPHTRGHFIPRFYLKGFTVGRTDGAELWVTDKLRRLPPRKSTPYKSGFERGMYDTDGHPNRDFFERKMGNAETIMAPILVRTLAAQVLPTGDDWIEFLGMVAVMMVRVPKYRNRFREMTGTLRDIYEQFQRSAEEGQRALEQMLKDDGLQPDLMDAEFFKNTVEAGGIDFMAQSSTYLNVMSQNAGGLVPILNERKWTIWRCDDDAPDLVCSDHPIAVTPFTPEHMPADGFIGLGTPNTFTTMPLDRRTLLVGTLEGQRAITLDRATVAAMNTSMVLFGDQIYSSGADFVWQKRDETVGNVADLLMMLAEIDSTKV